MQPSLREPGAAEVFICYRSSASQGEAQQIFGLLEDLGLNVFLDGAGIRAGDRWNDQIQTALDSPNLAVGIVLMTRSWFDAFLKDERWDEHDGLPDKPGVVVWEEVRQLRARRDVKVLPVFVRTPHDGNVLPDLPSPDAPGYAEIQELNSYLEATEITWIVPKKATRFDDLVVEAYDCLRSSVLQRPVPGTRSITAECVPPLALSWLAARPAARQAMLRYAEIVGPMRHDHKVLTILGAEALLRKDFDSALKYLHSARSIAHPDRDGGDDVFRSHLWHAHALNLFVIASFRGGRPRRRQITEASDLLRNALLKAVAVEEQHLTHWPPGELPQAAADRASAAYVAQMTLVLLWLLWVDFFLARNVHFPEATEAELKGAETHLNAVRRRLREMTAHGVQLLDADIDRRFLVERGFLEGMPERLSSTEAWTKAVDDGHIDKLLTGLTRVDHEREAEG